MPDALVPHPYAVLAVDREHGVPEQVRLYCPVHGAQLREFRVSKQANAELFTLLLQVAKADTARVVECSEEQAAFLVATGFLVTPEDAAQVGFPCTLDYPLLDGLPKRINQPAVSAPEVVTVNHTLVVERQQDDSWSHYPATVRHSFPRRRVWLEDPRTGQHVPFGRSPLVDQLLDRRAGVTSGLDARARTLLSLAGAVVESETAQIAARNWSRTIDDARDAFARNRYCVVRDVIPPLQLAALRLHYRSLVARGCFILGDAQVERRYWGYQEKVARFYHRLLTPLTSMITGQRIKPSYVYFASYLPGAFLRRHVDREQCAISISFLVDYSPDPDDASDWPIFVETPSNPGCSLGIELGPGDALFYKGCEVHHHRRALPPGRTSTSLFFHYVPEEFTASLG